MNEENRVVEPAVVANESRPVQWAIVECLGHRTYAGQIEEIDFCGAKLLRVRVPENDRHRAFEVDVAASAIYAVTRVAEATVQGAWNHVPAGYKKSRAPVALPHFGDEEIYDEPEFGEDD